MSSQGPRKKNFKKIDEGIKIENDQAFEGKVTVDTDDMKKVVIDTIRKPNPISESSLKEVHIETVRKPKTGK